MPGHPKLDTAVLATSGVITADQIMQAVRDHKEHHPNDAVPHYVKAAIAGAIAIGAYEKLRRNEAAAHGEHEHDQHHGDHYDDRDRHLVVFDNDSDTSDDDERSEKKKRSRHNSREGHNTDLVAEALGAYALGRQLMGHRDHPIVKLIAEGLGAAGLLRETERDI